uniref:Uncharacterized protein n=1 Tax=Zea mays TaxID=4577 RepID=B4FIF7_MAIZE|nr:unknown [Zea mays]
MKEGFFFRWPDFPVSLKSGLPLFFFLFVAAAAAGEQRRRVVQRDRHQLGGARRDCPQDQLLRGQDAHRSAPAAVPAVVGDQQDPQHQLAAGPSQQGGRPVAEGTAPGRGAADGGGDRGDGVAVPGAGEGRDVGRAGVAQGVDGLLRLQAGPERLLPAAGAAAGGARRERELLLPRVHAHGHDQGLGEAHRRRGGRRRGAARAAAAHRAPHGDLLQVAHAAAIL